MVLKGFLEIFQKKVKLDRTGIESKSTESFPMQFRRININSQIISKE